MNFLHHIITIIVSLVLAGLLAKGLVKFHPAPTSDQALGCGCVVTILFTWLFAQIIIWLANLIRY